MSPAKLHLYVNVFDQSTEWNLLVGEREGGREGEMEGGKDGGREKSVHV